MRATLASRSRSNAAVSKKPVTRQSNLTDWATLAENNNSLGLEDTARNQKQLRRFATIGLISRKKKQCMGAGGADKENGDMESRVASRRNLKAQQKAARKELRHLCSNISSANDDNLVSKELQLGLKTRVTKADDLILQAQQKNSRNIVRQNFVSAAVAQRR